MLDVINDEEYTMFNDYSSVEALNAWKECSVTDMGFVLNTMDNAFALQKDSQFKTLFNDAMRRIAENGELRKIVRDYETTKPECGGGKGKSLGFATTCFAIAVFMIGIGGCIAALLVEQKKNIRSRKVIVVSNQ